MLCTDLDRYLEAYVDGRLGRSRTGVLRRHLEGCGRCRVKVDRLRQFERDVGSRLKTPGEARSVWQGLQTELTLTASRGGAEVMTRARLLGPGPPRRAIVAGDRPPATRVPLPARGRRRLSQLAGLVALALACGAVLELSRGWVGPLLEAGGLLPASAQTAPAAG